MPDPYAVLGVERGASPQELKRAYRRLARQWHPDRNPAPDAADRFKEVAAAWEVLGDPERRRRHELAQGRVARGELPEAFLDDVANAIDRAELWIRTGVLPHYARYWRGFGAEMAARLIADLDQLATPEPLLPASWWQRRKLERAMGEVVVTVLFGPAHGASVLLRGSDFWEISILPWALYQAGLREPSELDDAILQLLVARYAQVLAGGHLRGDLDTEALVAAGRAADTSRIQGRVLRWGGWALLAGILGLMWLAGYNQW